MGRSRHLLGARRGYFFIAALSFLGAWAPERSAGAVSNGKEDGQPNVGFVRYLDAKSCSGVLITPAWVATARHCLNGSDEAGSPSEIENNIAYFDFAETTTLPYPAPDGWGSPSDVANKHGVHSGTFAQVPLYNIGSRTDGSVFSRSTDLAFYQLNSRIPISAVPPVHPPAASSCPGGGVKFNGTLVGYGPILDEANPSPPGFRNSSNQVGWQFQHDELNLAPGGFYEVDFGFNADYFGSEPGDSVALSSTLAAAAVNSVAW